jgi:hypothetical protein
MVAVTAAALIVLACRGAMQIDPLVALLRGGMAVAIVGFLDDRSAVLARSLAEAKQLLSGDPESAVWRNRPELKFSKSFMSER